MLLFRNWSLAFYLNTLLALKPLYFFPLWLHCTACGIIVPGPGDEPLGGFVKLIKIVADGKEVCLVVLVALVKKGETLALRMTGEGTWSQVLHKEYVCMLIRVCDPMDCSPPGSSVHEILQARILEWVAISSSRGSSWPRVWTHLSWIARRVFTTEPSGKPT